MGRREEKLTNEGPSGDDPAVVSLMEILQILERLPEHQRQRIIRVLTRLSPHELDLSHRYRLGQ